MIAELSARGMPLPALRLTPTPLQIGLWVWDELSFDTYRHSYNRIAQVKLNQTQNGNVNTGYGIVAAKLYLSHKLILVGEF
jgi:hypothetical protein